jgi:hypothetical protein
MISKGMYRIMFGNWSFTVYCCSEKFCILFAMWNYWLFFSDPPFVTTLWARDGKLATLILFISCVYQASIIPLEILGIL